MNDAQDSEPFLKEVGRMAREAVAQAQARPGSDLDFTPGSLRIIEEMLAEAAQYVDQLSDSQRTHIAQSFGCYVLEVGRREFGGAYLWHDQYDAPVLVVGEPAFHVAMVTWPRVAQRLKGDTADNIPFFYDGFVSRAKAQKPGDKALFV